MQIKLVSALGSAREDMVFLKRKEKKGRRVMHLIKSTGSLEGGISDKALYVVMLLLTTYVSQCLFRFALLRFALITGLAVHRQYPVTSKVLNRDPLSIFHPPISPPFRSLLPTSPCQLYSPTPSNSFSLFLSMYSFLDAVLSVSSLRWSAIHLGSVWKRRRALRYWIFGGGEGGLEGWFFKEKKRNERKLICEERRRGKGEGSLRGREKGERERGKRKKWGRM